MCEEHILFSPITCFYLPNLTTMDECTLNYLLECSVCFERLDTSSKVLPCQHTFCKKCLEEIVHRRKELRCPECRVLVDIAIDELPPNVLLMRILEGMKNTPCRSPTTIHLNSGEIVNTSNSSKPTMSTVSSNLHIWNRCNSRIVPQQGIDAHQPYAVARCDYISKEPGDLCFKKGDVILLRRRIEHIWYQGECNGVLGVFPLSYVQVIVPLPSHVPQCKALYDFGKCHEDDEGCLHFMKGDIITVIRHVDENWAEGKLEDRIGIFPISFVEMNSLAKNLTKSSSSLLDMSRVTPPTPTVEMVSLLSGDDISVNNSSTPQERTTPSISSTTSSFSTVSTATTSTTSSSVSQTMQSVSAIPTKRHSYTPAAQPPPYHAPPIVHRYSVEILKSDSMNVESTKRTSFPRENINAFQPNTSIQINQHSTACTFSDSSSSNNTETNKYDNEIKEPCTAVSSACIKSKQVNSNMILQKHSSFRISKNSVSTSKPIEFPALPAVYVAIYPYKPQKTDELELKIGCFYTVMERCQDGWFKGTSHPSQKCGVFPGNYVTPFKALPIVQTQLIGVVQTDDSLKHDAHLSSELPITETSIKPRSVTPPAGVSTIDSNRHIAPPQLPARSYSPHSVCGVTPQKISSTQWHVPMTNVIEKGNSAALKSRPADVKLEISENGIDSNTLQKSSDSSVLKLPEKNKERKEKVSVSLMKRLTSMKKTRSPFPVSSYSIDNPVFDDSNGSNFVLVAHARSDSCPSQLTFTSQTHATNSANSHMNVVSGLQRVKQKQMQSQSTRTSSAVHSSNSKFWNDDKPNISHRKSSSLDTTLYDERLHHKHKNVEHTSLERYRCVVPYPPNSEFELELKVGDVIFVHRKREDGWYKGTLQRNGRTGLFPANFVECI